MKHIFTREWWAAAGIRALKTVAQTAIATIGTTATIGQVDWIVVGSSSLLAGILSLLTSLAGLPEVPDEPKKVETHPPEDEEEHHILTIEDE